MHCLADDTRRAAASRLGVEEVATLRQVPVLRDDVACVGANGTDGAAFGAIDHADGLLRQGRHRLHAAQLGAQLDDITRVERFRCGAGASRTPLAGADK